VPSLLIILVGWVIGILIGMTVVGAGSLTTPMLIAWFGRLLSDRRARTPLTHSDQFYLAPAVRNPWHVDRSALEPADFIVGTDESAA